MNAHIVSRGAIRALLLFFVIGGFFYIGGCRKSDAADETDISNKKNIPDWVSENKKKAPRSLIIPVNQKLAAVFLDKQGNERPANYWRDLPASGNRSIPCDPFEDDFEDNIFTFNYINVNFYGYNTAGFNVESEYLLSTGFTILAADPGDPTKLTSGRVRVRDGATSNILYNFTDIPLTITNLGPDPSNSDKTLYRLKFTTPLINDPDVDILDIYFEVRPIVYTDCDEVIITTSSWKSWPFGLIGEKVCSRVDNIGIQPVGGGMVYISGCDAGTSYPPGVSVPHEQQIYYDAGSGWTEILFPLNSCTQSQKLLPFDVWPISIPTGTVKFRWRNIKHTTNNCAPNFAIDCTGPMYERTVTVP